MEWVASGILHQVDVDFCLRYTRGYEGGRRNSRRICVEPADVELRKARIVDVAQMERLIKYWADQNVMLHRSRNELYEHLRDYVVIADRVSQQIYGCGAL